MDRFAIFLSSVVFTTFVGCGSKESQVAQQPATSPTVSATPTASSGPSPTDVVSQFLDEVRRGGEDSHANDLLTNEARAALGRIGQSIQPIGSPDAQFLVTRAEEVPGDQTSALVHSVWSEPNEDGTKSDFQVVWAVQQEPAGWRISGLAMELDPKEDPVIMDFENAEMMSALLSPSENEPAAEAPTTDSQAVAPNQTISR